MLLMRLLLEAFWFISVGCNFLIGINSRDNV